MTVYFDNSDNKNYTINIYDGLGKKLANKSGVPMNNTMTINLAHLPIGLYVYEITENGSKASKTGEIIKE
jgi:hypothetical protein